MSKTITLRLKDEIYNIFLETAKAENRSISNLIETAALNKIREQQFVDDVEMAEILSNQDLLRRIKEGSNVFRKICNILPCQARVNWVKNFKNMYILNYTAIHTSGRISKNSRDIILTHGGIESALGVFSMKLMSKSKSFLCLPHLIEARRIETAEVRFQISAVWLPSILPSFLFSNFYFLSLCPSPCLQPRSSDL